jgi:SPP1 family predicted phage head-tail adaptor
MKGCRRPSGVSKTPQGDPSIAGELNKKIVIQVLTRTSDLMGGASVSWSTHATVFARIEPRIGNERYFGQRLEENITHIITTRYISTVTAAMQILYDNRTFQIHSRISPMENKQYTVFFCTEGTGT